MSKIVVEYDTYFEIKNGLFYPSVPDAQFTFTKNLYEPSTRITKKNLIDVVNYMFETSNISRINPRELVLYGSAEASENFNSLMESELQREGVLRRQSNSTIRTFSNMNEQEIIEYFDRISQEEEN